MIIVGMAEWLAYTMKYPGCSAFANSCQGSELIIGLSKIFCSEQGTGKDNMCEKLGDWLDLTQTCMVHNEQVDFDKILQKLSNWKRLIFDENKTPRIENQIETEMAPLMKYIVTLMEGEVIGGSTDPFLRQIRNALTLDVNAIHTSKLHDILRINNPGEAYSTDEEVDIDAPEYEDTMKKIREMNDDFLKGGSMRSQMQFASTVITNVL